MEIIVNGETQQVPEGTNAAQLVELLGLGGRRLAMEVNEELVPRSALGHHELRAGDRIEIVHAIGGG
ncbi:MAG: sulfur carrier protein ThiS [Gammaproteobacteria bacterium]|nr:sulfur carrier protein ThiS [Gammaproteobacteria bacterium]